MRERGCFKSRNAPDHRSKALRLLLRFVRTHAATPVATTLLSAASAAISIFLLANILGSAGIRDGASHRLIVGAFLVVALLGASAGAQFFLARLGGVLVEQLRFELCHRFLEIEYEKLIKRNDIVFSAIIQDIGAISPLVLQLPQLAYSAVVVLLCWIYL